MRRGENRTTLRLALATIEQAVVVEEKDAANRRDNGFTQTLTQEQIDSLPDDPDEMAEELQRMAGPGAQIFVNGFRGGRMPPKDQIQQIRFHTNSFSAEYHEAGMIRVEVITKPGLGGWRGHTNFGFRDESLNATNAFATEKGPEQMRRYMVNFQGPIAKGKTGLTMSFDGNSSYDSRTIVAQSPAGQPFKQLALVPTDAMNFNARVEQQLGANGQLQLEYTRRQNDRSNLGVGDFDLPERAYATDNSTDIFRVRSTERDRQESVQRVAVLADRLAAVDHVLVRVADRSRQRGVQRRRRRPDGRSQRPRDRDRAELRLHDRTPALASRRAAVRSRAGGTAISASNAFGTYTFTSLDAFNNGQPATYTIRAGDPLVEYSQTKAGWFIQDDFRASRIAAAQLRPAARAADAGRIAMELRAARGLHVERHPHRDRPRRLRHFL